MKLPRWTAYPALALLFAVAFAAFPRPTHEFVERAPPSAPPNSVARLPTPKFERVVVLGIDGMDPDLLREAMQRFPERMTNFRRLADEGGVNELGTSTPPQSPVAWSSFITGLDPGGHGVFDFIHRDPMHRAPTASTTRSEASDHVGLWGDWQFPLGGDSESNRTGKSFWEILAEHGVPADIWRMPANFPVEPAKGLSFSGMMTPALDSAYGEFTFYTTDPPAKAGIEGGRIVAISEFGGRVDTKLTGPPNLFKSGSPPASVPLVFLVDREAGAVAVDTGSQVLVLRPGEWSQFTRVAFSLLPMGMMDVSGEVRFYLRRIEPELELYASPVNIDPVDPVTPVSEPEDASAELADSATGGIGPYYTQGMPEDVNALKREVLTVPEFMEQASLVQDEGVRMLDYALDHYLSKPEGGFLFFYFSGVDLCSHMMWRHFDEKHPAHDAAIAEQDSSRWSGRPGSKWKDTVLDLYLQMDPVLGHLRERIGDATLIVMSDHGFAPYHRKFSLNTWLEENGYLVLKSGRAKELSESDPAHEAVYILDAVDWSKTRAYGVGFTGLYLNLAGRELDDPKTPENESGIVQPGAQADALVRELKAKLESLRDEERGGARVVVRCDVATEVFHGSRVAEAPDLIVGYDAGYGNSDESTVGRIPHAVLEDNLGGTFNGNHLMSPDVVAGLLMTNRRVAPGAHRLEDLTCEVLRRYGIAPAPGMSGKPVLE